jgi:hypothetical protein
MSLVMRKNNQQTSSGTSTPGVGGLGTGFSTLTKNRSGLGCSIFFSFLPETSY